MKGRVTKTGYRRNSPDVNNDYNVIPSNRISMSGVDFPVLGVDNLGNSELMYPGGEYEFQGDYVTELPAYGSGGLTQWFAEKWVDIKTGKECGRSGKDKNGRPYPACRPSKRVNSTTPKTSKEMSAKEKAKFKKSKTSGKRINYNHKRAQEGIEVEPASRRIRYEDGRIKLQDPAIYDGMLDETTVTPYTQSELAWKENRADQATGALQPVYPVFDAMTLGVGKGAKEFVGGVADLGKFGLREGVDLVHPVGRGLRSIKTDGIRKGLSPLEIKKNQMAQVGITSAQRKAYVPGVSEIFTEYIHPYSYDNAASRVLEIPKKIIKGNKNSKKIVSQDDFVTLRNSRGELPEAVADTRYDAWRLYSGMPQKNNTFRVANTTPVNHPSYSKNQLDNLEIFSFNEQERLLRNLQPMSSNQTLIYDMDPRVLADDLPYLKGKLDDLTALKNNKEPYAVDGSEMGVMGGYNRRILKGPSTKSTSTKSATNSFPAEQGVKAPQGSDQSLLEYNDIWDLDLNGLAVEKYFGKPFLSHGQMPVSLDPVEKELIKYIDTAEELRKTTINRPDGKFKELSNNFNLNSYNRSILNKNVKKYDGGSIPKAQEGIEVGNRFLPPAIRNMQPKEDPIYYDGIVGETTVTAPRYKGPQIRRLLPGEGDPTNTNFSFIGADRSSGIGALKSLAKIFRPGKSSLAKNFNLKKIESAYSEMMNPPAGANMNIADDVFSGNALYGKGAAFTKEETLERVANFQKDLSPVPFTYTHGTGSKSLPGIFKNKGLRGASELKKSNQLVTGEDLVYQKLAPHLYDDGIRTSQSSVSTASIANPQAAAEYAIEYGQGAGNYPIVFGINPKVGARSRMSIPSSTIEGEAMFNNGIGLDEISNIFVPDAQRASFIKNYGDQLGNMKLGSFDDYVNQAQSMGRKKIRGAKPYLYQTGREVKGRMGVRPNADGTKSTHLMAREYIDGKGWVAFPTLFQNSDSSWVDMSKDKSWYPVYEEAMRRGEVYEFGEDLKAAKRFADEGSWKKEKYQTGREVGPPSLTPGPVQNKVYPMITGPVEDSLENRIVNATSSAPKDFSRRDALLNASKRVSEGQGGRPLEVLLNMTAVMENSLGDNPKAYGRDYTRSQMSIDDNAYADLFEPRGEYDYTSSQKKGFEWLKGMGYEPTKMDSILRTDDPVAAMATARLVYGRAPGALPNPDSPKEVYSYYMDNYNKSGALKYGDDEKHYKRFLDAYNDLYQKENGGESIPVYNTYNSKNRAWLAARKNLGRGKQFMYGGKVYSTSTPNGL